MTEDRKKERKGFTLAELLIVVAIIGVLVAISIPILNAQLEKSREAHDIYTMRSALSLAVDYCYKGIYDETTAKKAGMGWEPGKNDDERCNAFGVFDPETSTFVVSRAEYAKTKKAYGKGTKTDGGTKYSAGEGREAYGSKEDYTPGVVMVAIYPKAAKPHIDVYWKDLKGGSYIGGDGGHPDNPVYSIREYLN